MLSFLRATKKQQASSGRQSIFQPAESDIFAKVTHLSFQGRAKFAAGKKLKYNRNSRRAMFSASESAKIALS